MSDDNMSRKPIRRAGDMVTVVVREDSVDVMMIDRRPRKNNQRFGTIRECLSQYGLSMKTKGGRAYLTAPRTRVQLFLEKLHYSGIPYKVAGKGV
jgi:hypothetical protein